MTLAALVFEGLVAGLLLVAAIMCWRVDARLRALKNGQDGVRQSIIDLNDATERARASLIALDRASADASKDLEAQVIEARKLADELRVVTSTADRQVESAARRPARRRAAEMFPGGAGSPVMNDLKDVR
jgi:hypothetical protein